MIEEELSNNLKDDNYTRNLVLYLLHYHQNTYSSLAFSDKNSYNDYLDSLNLKTLKGETVSSPAILNITDFLTENKVNYKIKNILEDNEIFNVISLDNDIDIIYFELDENTSQEGEPEVSEPEESPPSEEHENVSLTDSIMDDMEEHVPPDDENNEN